MQVQQSLRVDGEVDRASVFTSAELAALPAAGQVADVSRLDAKRRGKAVRLSALLDQVGVKPTAAYLTLHSSTDDFHASVPLASVLDRGIVIYEVDGGPVPASAGGPFRFFIPDFAACHSAEVDECANVKFVDRIELTRLKGHDNRPEDEKQHAALHEEQSHETR